MKRAPALTLLLILLSLVLSGANDGQYSRTVTVTSGTLTRVFNTRTMASSVLIQMLHGGTGYGLIYNANPESACTTGNLIAELAPATATAPGGSYSDSMQGGADLAYLCVSGSVTSDTILVSYRTTQ